MIGPHTASTSSRSAATDDAAATRQQPRMHAGAQGAAVVRAAIDQAEPRARLHRGLERDVGRQRVLGQAPPGQHDTGIAGLAQRRADPRLRRAVVDAVTDPLEDVRLLARPDQDVLGDVVQARARADGSRRPSRRARPPCAAAGAGSAPPARRRGRRRRSPRALDVAVGDVERAGGRALLRDAAVDLAAVVQVVRPEHRARQLRQRVGVLVHQAAAGHDRDPRIRAPRGDPRQDLAERGRLEAAVADQRRRDARRRRRTA